MAEYIALEAALKEIERFVGYLDDDMIYRIQIALKRIPTISKTAKWVGLDGEPLKYVCARDMVKCSWCGTIREVPVKYWDEDGKKMGCVVLPSRCPACDALMD